MLKRTLIMASCIAGLSFSASAESLDEALVAGLNKSETLMAAQQAFLSAKQSLQLAVSANDLSGTATVKGSHTESDKKSTSGGFQSSGSFSASVGISKRLYDSGEGEARTASADFALAAQRARYRAQEQAVILSVAEAYLNLVTAREALALQEENVARLEAQTQATEIRLQAGTTTATRLAEANARLARAQSNLIAAQTRELTAAESYQSLTGLTGDELSLPDLTMDVPSDLGDAEQMALANHPDVEVATLDVKAARADFDILAKQVLPKVNFSLSATDSQGKGTMNDKLDIKGELVFTSPILVTPASRAKGKQASAAIERAKYQLSDAQRRVALNARSSWRTLRSTIAQRSATEAELVAAELVAEGIRTEVEFGQKIFLDQLDAEQSVSDAKVRMVEVKQAIMLNHYHLLSALGELDLDAFGLASQAKSLDDLADPADVFTGFLPVADAPQ